MNISIILDWFCYINFLWFIWKWNSFIITYLIYIILLHLSLSIPFTSTSESILKTANPLRTIKIKNTKNATQTVIINNPNN